MDLAGRLTNLKKKVMAKIAEAAGAHDTRLIAAHSALANRIEDDERIVAAVEERMSIYEKELIEPTTTTSIRAVLDSLRTDRERSQAGRERSHTGREEGFVARKAFIDAGRNRGYHLVARGKTVFETPRGKRIAIPFANEKRPDRWFLGISDENYDVVVLLCQEGADVLHDFVLPWEFLEKFWSAFSRSGGEIKLNVKKDSGNWFLVIPGHGAQAIDRFRGNHEPLRY